MVYNRTPCFECWGVITITPLYPKHGTACIYCVTLKWRVSKNQNKYFQYGATLARNPSGISTAEFLITRGMGPLYLGKQERGRTAGTAVFNWSGRTIVFHTVSVQYGAGDVGPAQQ